MEVNIGNCFMSLRNYNNETLTEEGDKNPDNTHRDFNIHNGGGDGG